MKISKRKVAIVGCGLVGSTTAFSLITQGICEEVLMIDINKERAYGEMLDLQDTIEYLNKNVKVRTGDYSDCGDVDIIVITAGALNELGGASLLNSIKLRMPHKCFPAVRLRVIKSVVKRVTAQTHS